MGKADLMRFVLVRTLNTRRTIRWHRFGGDQPISPEVLKQPLVAYQLATPTLGCLHQGIEIEPQLLAW